MTICPKKRSPRNAKNKNANKRCCPVILGNEYEVEISQMSPNGEGLGSVNGFWVFVPGVKLGEKVKVKIKYIDSVSADAEVVPSI
jgi:predicted RNA-binding protein with TRAM domain